MIHKGTRCTECSQTALYHEGIFILHLFLLFSLVYQEYVQRNTRDILEAAIQQGAVSIAEYCLSELALDEEIISGQTLASTNGILAMQSLQHVRSMALLHRRTRALPGSLIVVGERHGKDWSLSTVSAVMEDMPDDGACDDILFALPRRRCWDSP